MWFNMNPRGVCGMWKGLLAKHLYSTRIRQLVKSPVGVEKGTKAVISANSSAYGELEFNNLRANFFAEIPAKEFFNSHAISRQLNILNAFPGHRVTPNRA